MERRLSGLGTPDTISGKKKGSAIAELIKYWAASSPSMTASPTGSPASSAAPLGGPPKTDTPSDASSASLEPKKLDLTPKPKVSEQRPNPHTPESSGAASAPDNVVGTTNTPQAVPSSTVDNSASKPTENPSNEAKIEQAPTETSENATAEVEKSISAPVEPIADTLLPENDKPPQTSEKVIETSPIAEPTVETTKSEPASTAAVDSLETDHQDTGKEDTKEIIHQDSTEEPTANKPVITDKITFEDETAQKQFIVTVTKVERRQGNRHHISGKVVPHESTDAPQEHNEAAATDAARQDDEETKIKQKLRKKRDQFLERRMSQARLPRNNFRSPSPIAAAMGYDENLSHEDVEDEIDYHAVTVASRSRGAALKEEDSDLYDSSGASDDDLGVEASPQHIENPLKTTERSHKRAASDGKQVGEIHNNNVRAHRPTVSGVGPARPLDNAASAASPDAAGQRKVMRTHFERRGMAYRDRQDSVYEAPVAFGSKPPKRPKYTGPAVTALRDAQRVIKEGLLLKKGRRGRWKRRYVVLDRKRIYIYQNAQELRIPKQIIPLAFAHCRMDANKDQKHFDFSILTPDKKIEVRADAKATAAEWVQMIQSVCDNTMLEQLGDLSQPSQSTDARPENQELIGIRASSANSVCADCGSADPEWASTNLGTFICIECSGVHRSLGTHISKVKSLTLDMWDKEQVDFMRKMGNMNANEIWEHHVPSHRTKPTSRSSLEEKKIWILSKYVKREFFDKAREAEFPPPPENKTSLGALLPEGLEDLKTCILELLRVDEDFRNQIRALLGPDSAADGGKSMKKSNSSSNSLRGAGAPTALQVSSEMPVRRLSTHSRSGSGNLAEDETLPAVRRTRKESSMKRSSSAFEAGTGPYGAKEFENTTTRTDRRKSRRLSSANTEDETS